MFRLVALQSSFDPGQKQLAYLNTLLILDKMKQYLYLDDTPTHNVYMCPTLNVIANASVYLLQTVSSSEDGVIFRNR